MIRSFVDVWRRLVNNPSRLLMMPIILIMWINVMNKTYLQSKNIWNGVLTDSFILMGRVFAWVLGWFFYLKKIIIVRAPWLEMNKASGSLLHVSEGGNVKLNSTVRYPPMRKWHSLMFAHEGERLTWVPVKSKSCCVYMFLSHISRFHVRPKHQYLMYF